MNRIDGFKHYYGNINGTIYSKRSKRFLKPSVSPIGYLSVTLCHKGIKYQHYVHRLIYCAFEGLIPKGLEINHIDGNKANNNLINLEVVTKSENARHAWRTGLCGHGELYSKK